MEAACVCGWKGEAEAERDRKSLVSSLWFMPLRSKQAGTFLEGFIFMQLITNNLQTLIVVTCWIIARGLECGIIHFFWKEMNIIACEAMQVSYWHRQLGLQEVSQGLKIHWVPSHAPGLFSFPTQCPLISVQIGNYSWPFAFHLLQPGDVGNWAKLWAAMKLLSPRWFLKWVAICPSWECYPRELVFRPLSLLLHTLTIGKHNWSLSILFR